MARTTARIAAARAPASRSPRGSVRPGWRRFAGSKLLRFESAGAIMRAFESRSLSLNENNPQAGVRLSVVVPVYNERFLVAELVHRVLAVSAPEIRELE